MQQVQTMPGSAIQVQQSYSNAPEKEEEKKPLKLSDFLGHLLFIATAFNWFLVFLLMQIHGNVYVTEVTPIREFEICMTGIVCGFSFIWFFKKVKINSEK